jgi:phage repressor protein C with HTH and peptisase S24 domain
LGFKDVNDDTVFNPEFNIDFPPANKQGVEWYRAKGNSMLEINSGDYVALEKVEDFSWFPLGRIYGVVTKNGFRTIKKVVQSENKNNYLLKASNPNKEDHPDQDIPKELITGIYKIIYVIKDLDE